MKQTTTRLKDEKEVGCHNSCIKTTFTTYGKVLKSEDSVAQIFTLQVQIKSQASKKWKSHVSSGWIEPSVCYCHHSIIYQLR